jgi:hypothetical protein
MNHAYIEAQGSLLVMKIRSADAHVRRGGGLRGKVTGFSKKSRHRMLIFMSRLRTKGARATFLSLTITRLTSSEEAKIILKRFLMRIRRAYANVSGVWRMEPQERGAWHFHLLLFDLPYIPQKRVQMVWEACTGETMSIVDIRLAKGKRKIISYIAKYISKPTEDPDLTSLEDVPYQHAPHEPPSGRVWGWINKKALPLGERVEGFLVKWATITWLRFEANLLSEGRASRSVWKVTLFSDKNYTIFQHAINLGGLDVQDFKDSTFAPSWQEVNPVDAVRFHSLLNQ